jgi:hypothetical protein
MMKYDESGSSDEAGSGSGSEDETEDKEEEEEETQVLLNRPPKRSRQEEKTTQGSTLLTPKVEGVPITSSKDRFKAICQALGELQGEHRMRGELLKVVCQLVDCMPTNLPDRIRKLVADHSQAEGSKKLRDENAALNLELGTLISESQAAKKQGEAALAAAEQIRTFPHEAGEVVAKAELFDEKVGIGSKPSGTRIAMILTDYGDPDGGDIRVERRQRADRRKGEQEQEPGEEKPRCGHDARNQGRRNRIRRGTLSDTGYASEDGTGDHGPRSGDCGVSHPQDN